MNDTDTKNLKIKCPVCENEFDYDIENLDVGDIIECPICGANLEVLSLEPFQVDSVTMNK